jgi:hypothetical protein
MDSASALLVLIIGLLALVFDRRVADTMNSASIAFGQLWPQWRMLNVLPPWSRERFNNWLWLVRVWAVFMLVMGLILLVGA